MTLTRIRALLLDSRTLLVPGDHEGCACSDCHPLSEQRRELRADLDDAIEDVEREIAHDRALASVGCKHPGCTLCDRDAQAATAISSPTTCSTCLDPIVGGECGCPEILR